MAQKVRVKYYQMKNQELDKSDFKEHFRKQLKFLRREAAMMACGDYDFAIPAATHLRKLFHNKPRSPSLLQHLGATDVEIVSFGGLNEDNPAIFSYYCYTFNRQEPYNILIIKEDSTPGAPRHQIPHPPSGPRTAEAWWNQIIVIESNPTGRLVVKRKDLVLTAADQDGGAHVDKKLEKNYFNLATNNWVGYNAKDDSGNEVFKRVENWHLLLLRHLVTDVLESPKFLELGD